MIPGELLVAPGDIELNSGRRTLRLTVANTGDRPIQVGSHFHFFETNTALRFDRAATRGFRLNVAAGTAVRFEPGQEREVELVALAGDRVVYGFNALVMGPLDARSRTPRAVAQAGAAGAATAKRAGAPNRRTPPKTARKAAKKGVTKTATKTATKAAKGGRR